MPSQNLERLLPPLEKKRKVESDFVIETNSELVVALIQIRNCLYLTRSEGSDVIVVKGQSGWIKTFCWNHAVWKNVRVRTSDCPGYADGRLSGCRLLRHRGRIAGR